MLFNKEPTVIIGVVTAIIEAVIPMLLVFDVIHWSQVQVGAVMLVVGVVAKGAAVIFARSQTVPVEKSNNQIATALLMPSTATVADVVKIEEEGSR